MEWVLFFSIDFRIPTLFYFSLFVCNNIYIEI